MINKLKGTINQLNGRRMLVIVFLLFVINVIIRFYLADFPKSITVYADELRYWDIADSLLNHGNIEIYNNPVGFYKILYSYFLMPAFFIDDIIIRIKVIALMNSMLMSSLVFPIYLLARKILKDNVYVLLCLAVGATVPDLVYTITFFSENLFYPLSLWLCYIAYLFFLKEGFKGKIILSLICGVVTFLAYLTKEVALYFLIAFIVAILYDLLLNKEARKQKFVHLVVYVASFALMYAAFNMLYTIHVGGGYENQITLNNISTLYKKIFLLYCCSYNGIMVLIAFMFFPIILPLLQFKLYDESDKKLIVFLICSLLVAIVTISYTISIVEDLGNIDLRQHFRYSAALYIPLLMLALKSIVNNKQTEHSKNKLLFISIIAGSAILFILMGSQFPIIFVDGQSLNIFWYIASRIGSAPISDGSGQIKISIGSMIVKAAIIMGISLVTIILYSKRTRRLAILFITVMIISIQLGNTVVGYKGLKNLYQFSEESRQELLVLDKKLHSLNGTILFVNDKFNRGIDTFITVENIYKVNNEELPTVQADENYIELSKKKLSNFFTGVYEDISQVNYIVTDGKITFDSRYVREIQVDGVITYHLYENLDPTRIFCLPESTHSD